MSAYGPGISAHTNIVPFGLVIFHPASFEPIAQRVAAALVDGVDLAGVIVTLVEGNDGCDLYGLEGAVVQIRLQVSQRRNHLRVADDKPNTPAGHRMALGERI